MLLIPEYPQDLELIDDGFDAVAIEEVEKYFNMKTEFKDNTENKQITHVTVKNLEEQRTYLQSHIKFEINKNTFANGEIKGIEEQENDFLISAIK